MSIADVLAVKTESKNLHAAIQWLMEQPHPHSISQIEEASKRFSLSPRSEDIVLKYFHEQSSPPSV
jgi:hypothetical protein